MHIREATASDRDAVSALQDAAFGQVDESMISTKLETDGDSCLSLLAEDNGAIIGQIQFYRIATDAGEMVGLGPMCVHPGRQRDGIGSVLIREGVTRMRNRGDHAVLFVLGHSDYYPRFGFSPERARDFKSPFSAPPFGDAFMAMDLDTDAPASATLTFPQAFR